MSQGTMHEEGQMDKDTPRFRYDARMANEIELRWQDRWERRARSSPRIRPPPTAPPPTDDPAPSAGFARVAGQPKFYLLDFFPYPSGSGCTWATRWATSAPTYTGATCG